MLVAASVSVIDVTERAVTFTTADAVTVDALRLPDAGCEPVTVMVAVPGLTAVTLPVGETEATEVAEETKLIVP